MANKPKIIDLSPEDLRILLERVKLAVSEEDYEKIKAMAETIEALSQVVDQKATSIKRLLKLLFGEKSEKKENVLDNSNNDHGSGEKPDSDNKPDEPKRGNGIKPGKKRKGQDAKTFSPCFFL